MMTDEFKAQFSCNYGMNYQKIVPDYSKCAAKINGGYEQHQCARKNGHGPHGSWCKQHNPEEKKAKIAARIAAMNDRSAERRRQNAFDQECKDAIRKIANGHNDPMGLAKSIVAKLENGGSSDDV